MDAELEQLKPKTYQEARKFSLKTIRRRFLKSGKTKFTEDRLIEKFIEHKKSIVSLSTLSDFAREFYFHEVLTDFVDEGMLHYDEENKNYYLTPYIMQKFEDSAFWHMILFRLPLALMILNILMTLFFNMLNLRRQNVPLSPNLQPSIQQPQNNTPSQP